MPIDVERRLVTETLAKDRLIRGAGYEIGAVKAKRQENRCSKDAIGSTGSLNEGLSRLSTSGPVSSSEQEFRRFRVLVSVASAASRVAFVRLH